MPKHPRTLEVEEKFALSAESLPLVRARLRELMFVEGPEKRMVDWYFDDEYCNLLRNDCWLRYRKVGEGEGAWQLKRGAEKDPGNSRSTVYDELDGNNALEATRDILIDATSMNGKKQLFTPIQEQGIPLLPSSLSEFNLLPYSSIKTSRASWERSKDDSGGKIAVDLDSTDFGYAVGEVEVCVARAEQVEGAKKAIRELVKDLVPRSRINEDSIQVEGKLEYYLEHQQPLLYKACVDFGVLQAVKK